MRCGHTASPFAPSQLAQALAERKLFRGPYGRSRVSADMSREARHPASKRTELLRVRLSAEERRTIRARAEECGKPTSTFVRELALGSVPRARPGRVEEKLIYHLGRIGNNLNQLARRANATGRLPERRSLDTVLEELLGALRRIA